jgi:hypothetical protein
MVDKGMKIRRNDPLVLQLNFVITMNDTDDSGDVFGRDRASAAAPATAPGEAFSGQECCCVVLLCGACAMKVTHLDCHPFGRATSVHVRGMRAAARQGIQIKLPPHHVAIGQEALTQSEVNTRQAGHHA